MPRTRRQIPAGLIFHVINRGVGRMPLFETPADFRAFETCLAETLAAFPAMRLCGYCVMSNHWHLVLWPDAGEGKPAQLSAFMQKLTITHVRRWVEFRRDRGNGHVYQGRYKSFPVETGGQFLQVIRYVERNALRANLVLRAEDWPHGSLALRSMREAGGAPEVVDSAPTAESPPIRLSAWPVARPADWTACVNAADSPDELEAVRRSVKRGAPYGSRAWSQNIAATLGLQSTLRPPGRPRTARQAVGKNGAKAG